MDAYPLLAVAQDERASRPDVAVADWLALSMALTSWAFFIFERPLTPMHATGIVGQLIGGPGAAVNTSAIPATLPFEEIVRRLNDVQPLFLVGYPSVLVRLADARRSGRLSIAPLAISATSTNGNLARILGWATTILMAAAAIAYLTLTYG